MEKKAKTDKVLMLMSALGIIFVIDVHMGRPLNIGTSVFPYDSFFMPMFVFISGYFFNRRHTESFRSICAFVYKKFMRLLLPFIIWSVVYGFLIQGVAWFGLAHWSNLTFDLLTRNILTYGTTFDVNGAAWFVPMLFFVTVAYAIVRSLLGRFWNDWAAMSALVILGWISLCFCKQGYNLKDEYLLLLKIGFFSQFFQFGYLFHIRLNNWFTRLNPLVVCVTLIVFNSLLMLWYPDITFNSCAFMNDFRKNPVFIPLLTSISGILFWLKISQSLVHLLGDNRLVNFISNNTFFLMEHHLLMKNIVYGGWAVLGHVCGLSLFASFNVQEWSQNSWYFWAPNSGVLVLTAVGTLILTLTACYGFAHVKRLVSNLLNFRCKV